MYRDEREALEAKLASLATGRSSLDAETDDLRAVIERHRALQRRCRWVRLRPLVLLLLGLLVLAGYAAATFGDAAHTTEARERRRVELRAQLREEESEMYELRRSLRQQLARFGEEPAIDRDLSELYGELRYLDGTNAVEARLIVGSVSCARRDPATVGTMRSALPEERRADLDRLCAPWSHTP